MQVKQSSYRWGQNSTAVVTCSSQRAHFSLVNLSTSSKFGGVPRWTLVFSSSHRFSIAFKSGLCADQSVTLTLVLHQECLFTYILGHCHVGRSRPSFSAYCFRLYTSSFFSPNISSIFVAREFQFSFIRSDELAVCIQVVEWSSWFSLYRFCTGLWWLSCPLQFLFGWVLHSCPGSCSGVFSHISRYFSF